MKILYHHRIGSRDGQAVHIEEMVRALRDLGQEVVVIGPRATERASFGAEDGTVAALKRAIPGVFYEWLELGYSLVAFARLWRAYRRERPDVVYERYNLYLLAGAWLKQLTGLPMLLEVNAPLVHERSRFGGLANRRLAAWVERITWQSADYVLPVTNVLGHFVRDAKVPNNRIEVIQNGVGAEFLAGEVDGTEIRRRHRIEGRVVLGFTGFVREWHGLERVIGLIAERGRQLNLHLLLVGDGPALGRLRKRAAELGVEERVTFAGLVPRSEIARYVAAFDVAMQPRVVSYASPLKLFEYMAMGRAIVAPDAPNIREVLSEAEALLFDPDDNAAFRGAVERLCADAELRARLGAAAKACIARQGLTWSHNAARVVRLFDQLSRSSRRSARSRRPGEARLPEIDRGDLG